MKRIIILILLLLPLGLQAQETKKSHFEIGTGLAIPREMLFDNYFKEDNAANVYGEYRYDLTDHFAVGAVYSFVFPHSAVLSSNSKVVDPLHPEIAEESDYDIKTMHHTLNAFVEYKTQAYGPVRFFAGAGGGAQMRSLQTNRHGWESDVYFSANLGLHAGLEFFEHIRVTTGHYHDLHYPISGLPRGAPHFFVNVGWTF